MLNTYIRLVSNQLAQLPTSEIDARLTLCASLDHINTPPLPIQRPNP